MKFELYDTVKWLDGYEYIVFGYGIDSKNNEWYLVENKEKECYASIELFRDYELEKVNE